MTAGGDGDSGGRDSGDAMQRMQEERRACYAACSMTRDPAFLAECRALQRAVEPFPTLEALRASPQWPGIEARLSRLLSTPRRHTPIAPPAPPPRPERVGAVHWNIEHGNWYEQVERALLEHPELRGADLFMFNEIDFGMARAANREVTADLAAALGLHGAWAPLFLETTLGRDDDVRMAAGRENQESLFGLALLSRWPIGEIRLIDLPSPDAYQFNLERMVGRHVALVATIERPGAPFIAVSVHLEVHRTRAHRAAQMRALLEALREEQRPLILAGDFNSHTFDRGRPWDTLVGAAVLALSPDRALARRLLHPDHGGARERIFDELASHGFEWERFVDREPTLQLRFERLDEIRGFPDFAQHAVKAALAWAERRGRLRLDWFAGRGWKGGGGHTVRGLDGPGRASDHAPIVAWFE
jgi:endonuclease/exonuclease/phosphatase family metal-dependent hydrolase